MSTVVNDMDVQICTLSWTVMVAFQAVWLFMKKRMEARRNSIRQRMELARRQRIQRTIRKVLLVTKEKKRKRVWQNPKTSAWWDDVVSKYNDEKWLENFRVRKGTFEFICSKVSGILALSAVPVIPNRSLSVEKIVAIALYKLSHVAEYQTVGNLFGVHKSTVHNCLYAFCLALTSLVGDEFIKMPSNEEAQDIAANFERQTNIPQIIGAIDGSHIPITAPEDGHVDLVNRKMFCSLVLQAIVDHQYLFRDISCKLPGSCHDADVLRERESSFYKNIDKKMPKGFKTVNGMDIPFLIMGDPAYPLQSWLMKNYSYDAHTTQEMDSFNVYLNKGRIVVENAFGRLKGRWRILLKRSEVHYTFVPTMVAACCILHNICEMSKETFNNSWLQFVKEAQREFPQEEPSPYENENCPDAADIRDHLMLYLSSNFEILQSIRGRVAAA